MTSAPLDLETYYSEAGMDYRAWSRKFNMHFGFYRWGMNPFRLESMLEEMSRQVFARLEVESGMQILDLGCGLGAPARTLIAEHAVAVTAVTKVEWQIAMAKRLSGEQPLVGTVEWLLGDYTALPLPDRSYDAAFSLEASCHAPGPAKEPFVREAARLLRPGARLVVADGIMKKGAADLPRWYRRMIATMTHAWAVEEFAELGAFRDALERHGFAVERVEDISWKIVPSVLHVPRVTLAFLARELLVTRRWLNRTRRGHLLACLLSPLVGLARSWFGYYLITARKL